MEFRAREDIEAPLDHVFREISDFPAFERAIMRRGGDVAVLPGPVPPERGARWEVRFRFRGKDRRIEAMLDKLDPAQGMSIAFESPNIKGDCVVDLVPLSPSRTRLNIVVSVKPVSIAAKLIAQSLRFGKHRMTRRFKTMVMTYAEDVEARYRATA